MAPKRKTAAKGSGRAKAAAPTTPAKKTKATKLAAKSSSKPAPKKSAAPKSKGAGLKSSAKSAKVTPAPATPAKVAAAKPAPPTPSAAGSAPAGAPQLARAKSALKRQKPTPAASPKSEKARARKLLIEVSANEAASALAAKWGTLFKRADHIEAKPYNMNSSFEERTAIVHKVLGWGYILANRNDRLEVLFKDGIKYLISNYKP